MSQLFVGRYVNPETWEVTAEDAVIKPDRLTRHAVCVGMTGSGKTGLCVTLLEELALAGVPVIVIDPKGDMTNLALAFDGHPDEAFEPWVDPAEAQRKGLSVPEFAAKTAAFWRQGMQEWGVDDERVSRFVNGASVDIYTPGSSAGTPVDTLGSLGAPPAELRDDPEALSELVTGTVGALLGLVGEEGDPVSDPAHVSLQSILMHTWSQGTDLELGTLLPLIVDPPFDKVGFFPLDTFWPRKKRMELALKLNGVVASPAFAAWSQGVPLDPDHFLRTDGKTPISIFYLSHLDESQRMFFASMLLNQLVGWSRRQPGTSSLRALVYFDEVFGYLPPYPKNPPTKRPVLTLMKQARAVGVGTMLVTQNPVDVDYKAMSNAGTWFVGRLQTQQDRERVVDGLAAAGGAGADRTVVEGWLENLPPRNFVLRQIKDPAPKLIHSRHAISYLRGPLTKIEIERLPKAAPADEPPARSAQAPVAAAAPTSPAPADEGLLPTPPPAPQGYEYRFLDPSVVFGSRLGEYFAERARPPREDRRIVWEPALYAKLKLRFDEGRSWAVDRDEHRIFFPIEGRGLGEHNEPPLRESDFLMLQPEQGLWEPLPTNADEARELKTLERRVVDSVLDGETEKMFRNTALKLVSKAGESRDDFRARCSAVSKDLAAQEITKVKERFDDRVERLEKKIRDKEQQAERYEAEAGAQKTTELVSAAEAVFGWFTGSRRSVVGSAMRRRQQTQRAQGRVADAQEDINELNREVYDLENEAKEAIDDVESKYRLMIPEIEEIDVGLEKSDIRLDDFGIVWVPVTRPV